MKRKPPPPRPDGKPRRKWKPGKKPNAERLADAMVKRGAFRVKLFSD